MTNELRTCGPVLTAIERFRSIAVTRGDDEIVKRGWLCLRHCKIIDSIQCDSQMIVVLFNGHVLVKLLLLSVEASVPLVDFVDHLVRYNGLLEGELLHEDMAKLIRCWLVMLNLLRFLDVHLNSKGESLLVRIHLLRCEPWMKMFLFELIKNLFNLRLDKLVHIYCIGHCFDVRLEQHKWQACEDLFLGFSLVESYFALPHKGRGSLALRHGTHLLHP